MLDIKKAGQMLDKLEILHKKEKEVKDFTL
jgi:hypothetical protein